MKPYNKFKTFQIRWKEKLGKDPKNPYLVRWSFIFFNFSIRIHHWIRSDDTRFFHNHACDFVSICLKGKYENVTPEGTKNIRAGMMWFFKSENRHYLKISKRGAWTLLLCGKPYRKWGFWIKPNQRLRPLEYFHRYGQVNE